MPLKPSGQTPTSSPPREQPLGVLVAGQRRAALAGQLADERQSGRPGRRRAAAGDAAGCWSWTASSVISASSGIVPEWLDDDQRAALGRDVLDARGPRPGTTSRRSGAARPAGTCSVISGSKPNSSTS